MWRILIPVLSVFSLIICLASPLFYFLGKISVESYKLIFLFASAAWFIFGIFWASIIKKSRGSNK